MQVRKRDLPDDDPPAIVQEPMEVDNRIDDDEVILKVIAKFLEEQP